MDAGVISGATSPTTDRDQTIKVRQPHFERMLTREDARQALEQTDESLQK
jgi:hypothetical protein